MFLKGTAGARSARQINRFRSPSDGDVLMPGKTVCLFGTTDIHVQSPDDGKVVYFVGCFANYNRPEMRQ